MKRKGLLAVLLVLAMAGAAWAGTITATVGTSKDALVYTWAHLVSANASGSVVDCRKFRSLEVQIKGTWNTGTLTVQGSDDGTNYLNLRDLSTLSAISYAADPTTLIVVLETPNFIKPVLSGAGTDDVTVTVTGRN